MGVQDWYARKLGHPVAPAPPQPHAPGRSPFATAPAPGPAPAMAPAPQQYGGFVHAADGETVDIIASAANWRGGKGNQDVQQCPECGEWAYFSPSATGSGIVTRDSGKYARQCYECGYPVVQFGSHGGVGGLAERAGVIEQ